MAWPPTTDDLRRAREGLEQRVAERPRARLLEPLARTHRWLDEREPASRRFHEAADDVARVLEETGPRGRGRRSRISSTGSARRSTRSPGPLGMSLFDWFEEAALIEAWLQEERRPGHAELLALLGS